MPSGSKYVLYMEIIPQNVAFVNAKKQKTNKSAALQRSLAAQLFLDNFRRVYYTKVFESPCFHQERNLMCLPNQVSFSYIRLRRVILHCSYIRLAPSDIALRAVKGEYNITSRVSEKYNCPAGTISLPLKAAISLTFPRLRGFCVQMD